MFAELDQIRQSMSTCGQASTRVPSFLQWEWEERNVTGRSSPGQIRNAFPSRLATSVYHKDLIPASSNLPCLYKRKAKLLAEVSVSGCLAPSWDSPPSKARRWRPSAWRLEMERWGVHAWEVPQVSWLHALYSLRYANSHINLNSVVLVGCQFQPGNDWGQLLGWGLPRCIEMRLFICMSLICPNFWVVSFNWK